MSKDDKKPYKPPPKPSLRKGWNKRQTDAFKAREERLDRFTKPRLKEGEEDPLLKRARLLSEQAESNNDWREHKVNNTFEKMAAKYKRTTAFTKNTFDTLGVIWNTYLKPISYVLNPIFSAYWKGCKWAFNKVSFDSNGDYSKYRGAAAAVGLSLLTIFNGYAAVTTVIPSTISTVYDAAIIETFSYNDTLLFSKPDLIDADKNIWNVSACEAFPCEGQVNTTEYRMRDSNWLDFKQLLFKFDVHDPGELKGAFKGELSACNVTVYGKRIKVPLVPNWLGAYPYITHATCIKATDANSNDVLEQMRSMRPDLQKPAHQQSQLGGQNLSTPTLSFAMN